MMQCACLAPHGTGRRQLACCSIWVVRSGRLVKTTLLLSLPRRQWKLLPRPRPLRHLRPPQQSTFHLKEKICRPFLRIDQKPLSRQGKRYIADLKLYLLVIAHQHQIHSINSHKLFFFPFGPFGFTQCRGQVGM